MKRNKFEQRVMQPFLQIRSRCAVSFDLPLLPTSYNRKANITRKGYSGGITAHAEKRIKRCCEILLMLSPEKTVWNTVSNRPTKFRLTFITVTISCQKLIPHEEAYLRGLKPLLRWLRDKQKWQHYIWKAELQARGQVHYHITGNQFLDFRNLKSFWNNVQYRNGWLDEFHAKHGHWSPNSTDIHAVEKVNRLDLYLAKYISKSGGQINGKCWDCSNSLAGKKYFTLEMSANVLDLIWEAESNGNMVVKKLDHCAIIETNDPTRFIPPEKLTDWQQWLK